MSNQTLSTIYTGGGTSGAVKALTTGRTIALSAGDTIDTRGVAILDVYLANTSATKSGTLVVAEYKSQTASEANLVQVTEVSIPSTDHTATINKKTFGLASAIAYSKEAVAVPVMAGECAKIAMSVVGGGTFFARYTKRVNE